MIYRILGSYLFISLLLAFSLALFGVENVQMGSYLQSLIMVTSRDLAQYSFTIPNIPSIETMENFLPLQDVSFWEGIINLLQNIGNVMLMFFNGIIQVLNFVIMILNFIVQMLEFIFLLIRNIFVMRDSIVAQHG